MGAGGVRATAARGRFPGARSQGAGGAALTASSLLGWMIAMMSFMGESQWSLVIGHLQDLIVAWVYNARNPHFANDT
jgi:hypothetical protein